MVDGVLMLVLNPSNPVSISVNSCEQVYIRIILRHLAPNVGLETHFNPSRRFLGAGFTGTPRDSTDDPT